MVGKVQLFFFFFLYRNWLHSLIWSHTITFSRKQNFGDSTSLGDPIFVRKIWLQSSKILSLDSLSVLFPPSFCIHLPKSFPAENINRESVNSKPNMHLKSTQKSFVHPSKWVMTHLEFSTSFSRNIELTNKLNFFNEICMHLCVRTPRWEE